MHTARSGRVAICPAKSRKGEECAVQGSKLRLLVAAATAQEFIITDGAGRWCPNLKGNEAAPTLALDERD